MEAVHIYFMPGMAANSKIFEKLNFPPHYQLHYLEWIDPKKNETLADYSKRLCAFVKHENPVLVGVSFGGIIVQEIKNLIKTRKTIIISSVKSTNEFSPLLKITKFTKIFKFFPFLINRLLENFIQLYYRKKANKYIELYNFFLSKRDSNYLHWALYNLLYWDRELIDPEVIHLHGNRDEIFPLKYIKNCNIVNQGTHVMILTKAKKISQLIQQNIENER